MPDNPDVKTLLARAEAARAAQDKLRAAMAAVAADAKPAPVSPPATGGSQ